MTILPKQTLSTRGKKKQVDFFLTRAYQIFTEEVAFELNLHEFVEFVESWKGILGKVPSDIMDTEIRGMFSQPSLLNIALGERGKKSEKLGWGYKS